MRGFFLAICHDWRIHAACCVIETPKMSRGGAVWYANSVIQSRTPLP